MLEPLGEKTKAGAIPVHDLDEVGLPAPEHEKVAREGILPQDALDQHGEPVDALIHVDEAEGRMLHSRERKVRETAI